MNDDFDIIINAIENEFMDATREFGAFHNAHEGYAVLLEEVNELWDNIKLNQKKNPNRLKLVKQEAIQVAAMAIRLIYDCCEVSEK